MSKVYAGDNKEVHHLEQKEAAWQNHNTELNKNVGHFRDW